MKDLVGPLLFIFSLIGGGTVGYFLGTLAMTSPLGSLVALVIAAFAVYGAFWAWQNM